jgi:hypothetical protein
MRGTALKIRDEQFEVFQPQADARFVADVVRHLREEYADAVVQLPSGAASVGQLPSGDLHAMVSGGLERARRYGMVSEAAIASFIVLMFVVAPNFDEHPLINRVLRDATLLPDSRVDALWERTTGENWEAAEQNYRASCWDRPQKDEA